MNTKKVQTIFVMNLLIPERSLKDMIAKLLLPSINALAEIFQVPRNLMIRRMDKEMVTTDSTYG